MKRDGEKANLFIWDSEKQNIDGKPLGEYIAIMYRNILPNDSWEHSIATMLPTEYFDGKLEPIDHVTNPDRQLATSLSGITTVWTEKEHRGIPERFLTAIAVFNCW